MIYSVNYPSLVSYNLSITVNVTNTNTSFIHFVVYLVFNSIFYTPSNEYVGLVTNAEEKKALR